MKIRSMLILAIVAVCFASRVNAVDVSVSKEMLNEAASSYIFVFKPSVEKARVSGLSNQIAVQHSAAVRHVFKHSIKGFSANVSPKAMERMAANPNVAYVEKNGIVWASVVPGRVNMKARPAKDNVSARQPQQVPYGIARSGGPIDGTGKHAWIIDTGIDASHPDLNVGIGETFVSRGRKSTHDENGHGTHVAGTVAAIDNEFDVVGMAANATVHPVKVLDGRGSGTIDGVIAGVDYVAQNATAGSVANMSLGARGHSQSLHDAVLAAADKGIYFAIAAGNDGEDANNFEPAHVEHPNVFTVSAVEVHDIFASFSNYMNPPVDFAAHGVGVLSTKTGGGLVSYSGTSMAAPHVAGLLLFGVPNSSGYAISDPDGNPDPVAHH